jgi:hypothetical protein
VIGIEINADFMRAAQTGTTLFESIRTMIECNGPGIFNGPLRAFGVACGNGVQYRRRAALGIPSLSNALLQGRQPSKTPHFM